MTGRSAADASSGLRPSGGAAKASPAEPLVPNAGEIAMYISAGYADFCVNMPSGKRCEPEELWVPALSCWVRADGTRVSFDIQHGFAVREFGWFGRWQLRRAVARFRWLNARTEELIERCGLNASADTHAERGDAKQAPSARMGSAVPKADAHD